MNVNKGQSLLELAAVITLVTLGVFFAGPTIIRSVNAHFKIWDDSIQDSYSDPMHKAPIQNLPTTCVCSDWTGAVGQRCGLTPCTTTEHMESRLCNPAGCGEASAQPCVNTPGVRCINPVERCIDDRQCCTQFEDTATCGTGGLPTDTPPHCPVGQRLQQAGCGQGVYQYRCRLDSDDTPVDGNISCVPQCLGQYSLTPPTGNLYLFLPVICPGDNTGLAPVPPQRWSQDQTGFGLPIRILGTGANSCNHPTPTPNPNLKCETYCINGYEPAGSVCERQCAYVVSMDWPHTGADDIGEVHFYKNGTIRHIKDQDKDVPLDELTGPIQVHLADGTTVTQDYGGNGGASPAGRLITLPGNWSLITSVDLALSNLSRSTVWKISGSDNYGDYVGFAWNDDGPTSYVSFDISVTINSTPPRCYSTECNWSGSHPWYYGSGGGEDLTAYCTNNIFMGVCAGSGCPASMTGGTQAPSCSWTGTKHFPAEVNGNDDLYITCNNGIVTSMCSNATCSGPMPNYCNKSLFNSDWCDGNDISVNCSNNVITQFNLENDTGGSYNHC